MLSSVFLDGRPGRVRGIFPNVLTRNSSESTASEGPGVVDDGDGAVSETVRSPDEEEVVVVVVVGDGDGKPLSVV
jgi:hypothetical protein